MSFKTCFETTPTTTKIQLASDVHVPGLDLNQWKYETYRKLHFPLETKQNGDAVGKNGSPSGSSWFGRYHHEPATTNNKYVCVQIHKTATEIISPQPFSLHQSWFESVRASPDSFQLRKCLFRGAVGTFDFSVNTH